jgi:N-acetylglucosaminyl-diphospho-decaprenol L-rhamnosyltransferase
MTEVTLVIGNYEGEGFLDECVSSAREQSLAPREIIVVDGASGDASRERAAELGARVLHVENRGLAFLYNRGVDAATTDYVVLSNTDVVYEPHCFEELAAALDANPSAFAADARQLDWAGERTVHARTTLRRGRLFHEWFPGLHLDHVVPSDETSTTVVAHGAVLLVRRKLFLEVGGFDETFFLDFEDVDLCWRAWSRGWASLHVPAATVRHYVGGVTTQAVLPRRLASSHHNILRFALKCLPGRAAATVVLGELLRTPAHPRALVPAFAAVLRELREILRLRRQIAPRRELLDWLLAGEPGGPTAVP